MLNGAFFVTHSLLIILAWFTFFLLIIFAPNRLIHFISFRPCNVVFATELTKKNVIFILSLYLSSFFFRHKTTAKHLTRKTDVSMNIQTTSGKFSQWIKKKNERKNTWTDVRGEWVGEKNQIYTPSIYLNKNRVEKKKREGYLLWCKQFMFFYRIFSPLRKYQKKQKLLKDEEKNTQRKGDKNETKNIMQLHALRRNRAFEQKRNHRQRLLIS